MNYVPTTKRILKIAIFLLFDDIVGQLCLKMAKAFKGFLAPVWRIKVRVLLLPFVNACLLHTQPT
jgi:hypothetical protein